MIGTTRHTPPFEVSEGVLTHGMPYLALGRGRPLLFLRWFTPDHANPTGRMRASEIATLAPLARRFRVYAVGRAPGMAPGTTMADIAAEHAEAIRDEFGCAVDVLGVSSGGSIALQLAADHPDAVRSLTVVSSGYALSPAAKQAQMSYAKAIAAGRRGLHHMAPVMVGSRILARLVGAALWLADPLARPVRPTDTAAFLHAEDEFDLEPRLGEITAPTLVLGGDRDACYPVETFRRTAAGIPDAQLIVYPGIGHRGAVRQQRFAADIAAFIDAADQRSRESGR
ncbi:alpha/beta fold hydrolase [Nocardia veterana]|uniref:Alpha/beta fold hydrolase n=1 Tax=Nocardia veterana TaxID=132249 RepID=A0A7X6RIP1_9NOCA|nr:alpha/beta hydrolase [Nocardia veterana]NKY86779.1 alpha/beta fold hydrolase [Nocardia veterana]